MGIEALRTFCDSIREFTQGIGKERFLLAGEIGGGREIAWEVVEKTGLDAALGIEDVPGKLERMISGYGEPADYFSIFRNWMLDDQSLHRWYRNQRGHVGRRSRSGSQRRRPSHGSAATAAFATSRLTWSQRSSPRWGSPASITAPEQGFDSGGRPSGSDLVLRENMFGGRFGGQVHPGPPLLRRGRRLSTGHSRH